MKQPPQENFSGRILMLGCGLIGQAILPLLLRHLAVSAARIQVLTGDERGREVARKYEVGFTVAPLTPANFGDILTPLLEPGDFLLNLSSDVASCELLELCGALGVLYLDTCIDSWKSEVYDSRLSVSERSLYALRDRALAYRARCAPGHPTAVLAHGANPGLVSHFVKQALWNLARLDAPATPKPQTREQWAALSRALGIKAIHIAERDTQISSARKMPGEFVNTWSIDGLVGEAMQPAEMGWGSHERHFPADGACHAFGDQSGIYLNLPGAAVKVRTWLPLAGPQIGFLITHNESLSIASYLTLGEGAQPEYRPTVHYAYHPSDDALLSLYEFQERNWVLQERLRPVNDCLVSGIDELGVLLIGNARGVYWYGSRLSVEQARELAPHNSATSLQVAAGTLAGMVWAMRHPRAGIVEAEQMDFEEVLAIALPYLGEMAGEFGNWNPLAGRNELFPEDIDTSDPWQFKNLRV
ncbi:homospermidine synthase [Pseudoduganella rhizocola]|uniref:homospermidine synthase n=1 Tax=Pseudoduganella rhizocola TaxID=3382643 RepID=UPI0038B53A57